MFDTLAYITFCLSVFVIGFILVRRDKGASTKPKGPWRPPRPNQHSDKSDAPDPDASKEAMKD